MAVIWLLAFTIVLALGCREPIAAVYAVAALASAVFAVLCAATPLASAIAALARAVFAVVCAATPTAFAVAAFARAVFAVP